MKKIILSVILISLSKNIFCQTTYYSKSAGNLNALATWGTNANGTGASPANFTSANVTYIIVNNAAPTISANWTVSGAGSKVQVGDGIQAINFTIPMSRTLSAPSSIMLNSILTIASGASVTGTINVTGTLDIQDNGNPTIGTIAAGSTVKYSRAGNQTVLNVAYANLTLGGSGIKTLDNTTNTSVANVMTINSGVTFKLPNANTLTLSLNGTITGAGTITGVNNGVLAIGGSGAFGTLNFTAGSQMLYSFSINRGGSGIVTLGTALTVANSFTHANGILSLNGQTLSLNGAIIFPASVANGSISGSATSTLNIGGAGTITNYLYMTQAGTANYLKDITLNRAAQSVTIGNALNIVGTITPTAGIFNANGNTILVASSSTAVGRVGTIGASASMTGNLTVQTYAKGGKTGWTNLSSAGISGRTFADWNDDITVTCASCPNGFWYSFTSVYSYDETVGGIFDNSARYIPITTISDALSAGKGYWVYFGNGTGNTSDIILDVTGPVNQGNFNYNITITNTGGGTNATDHGYNLIANPYPSPIQWSLLRNANANVANAIYAYNPDFNAHSSFVNGVSSPAVGAGGIGNFIPAGQAFYVKASAATTLTALETNKGASTQELLRSSGSQQTTSTSTPMVMRLKANGHSMTHETAIYFDANATSAYEDEYDARYMAPDAGFLGIATRLAGNDYSINGLPPLNQNFSIPVKVTTDTTDVYTISATDLQNIPYGACVVLHDNYTNANKDLRTGAYSCTIRDTEKVVPRFVLNITINNNLLITSAVHNPTCSSSLSGYITAQGIGSGPWNYYWKDANNNVIRTAMNKPADTLSGIAVGNYLVDITTSGCSNGTQNFTLQATQPVISAYNPSATSVIYMADSVGVTFTNISTNANTYWWDFGDGAGVADTSVTHYFMSPGDFTVTLYAINAACGDTSSYKNVINVIDGTVGIAAYAQPSKNMFISRDEKGYFVKFNYADQVDADLSVQNIYGSQLINGMKVNNVTNDKIYVPLENIDEQIMIISVVTSANEKTYCKVLNIK